MGEFSEPGCRHGWRQANVPEAGNARDRARVCACQSVPEVGNVCACGRGSVSGRGRVMVGLCRSALG